MHLSSLHPLSKILIVIIGGAVLFSISFILMAFLSPVEHSWGRYLLGNFSTFNSFFINIGSVILGLIGMLIASLKLFKRQQDERDFTILKQALSSDETALLEQVKQAPDGVTQDSLRFRLDWSKAKISTTLSRLDRMGFVQRERFGKTYKVYYQKPKADG